MADSIKVSTDNLAACAMRYTAVATVFNKTASEIITKFNDFEKHWCGDFSQDLDSTINSFDKSNKTIFDNCNSLAAFINEAVEKYKQVDKGLINRADLNSNDYPGNVEVLHKIRYVSQLPNCDDYVADYWGNYSPKSGCAVSCTSMALSSLGIDMLPSKICDNNGGSVYMYWGKSGKYRQTSGSGSLDDALSKYQSDPAHNAPPIVLLPNQQHYVVVIGKNSDGSYQTMDPAVSSAEDGVRNHLIPNTKQIIQYYI